jgi:hypothetical protein
VRAISLYGGAMGAVALMVLGLWAWQHAAEVATDTLGSTAQPYVAKWAVRSAAIAAAAAAQAVLLTAVVGRVYGRQGALDAVLRLSALLVFAVALVSAVALGLAGR